MPTRRTAGAVAVLVAAQLAVTGAAIGALAAGAARPAGRDGTPVVAATPGPSTSPTPTPTPVHQTPAPRRTIIIRPKTNYLAGQTATVVDPGTRAALHITASVPSGSTTHLGSYGYDPQNGLYLTFRLTVTDIGSAPVEVVNTDFVLTEPGHAPITVDEGNAPYSGEAREFDTTVIPPGQSLSGNLTYDVSGTHGVLAWAPGGRTTCTWRF